MFKLSWRLSLILAVLVLLAAATGPVGIALAGLSAIVGLVPVALRVRRVHLMASLLIPVLLTYIGPLIWAHHSLNTSSPGPLRTQTPPRPAIITIPREEDLFVPFLLVVPLHTPVTWRNDDTVAHLVTTTAQQSRFLNRQAFSFRVLGVNRSSSPSVRPVCTTTTTPP